MTAHYLLKTEPSEYSFADLVRERETLWDGIANAAALKHLRGMQSGDRLVIYETGSVKSAIGTASVVSVLGGQAEEPRVRIKAGKTLPEAVSLAQIKSLPLFADSPLVRQGRLSVVPLSLAQYRHFTGGKP